MKKAARDELEPIKTVEADDDVEWEDFINFKGNYYGLHCRK